MYECMRIVNSTIDMIFCLLQDAIKTALIECAGHVIDGLEERCDDNECG